MSTTPATPEIDQAFLNDVSHVPDEIPDDRGRDFREVRAEAPGATGEPLRPPGWTVEEIADMFNGCFTVLVCTRMFIPLGGEHWIIPRDACLRLAQVWLPIFIKHVPYESRPTWMPDFLLYVTVLGTTRDIIGPAIAEEIRLSRGGKSKARQRPPVTIDAETPAEPSTTEETTKESTETATSPESSAPAENASQEKPPTNGWKSNLQTID